MSFDQKSSQKQDQSSILDAIKPFVMGGFSGMVATCCIQPIDTVKVRIQIMGENLSKDSTNPFTVAGKIIKAEGVSSLYKGLGAALTRQATYTTAKLGFYRLLFNKREQYHQGPIPFHEKLGISLSAGFIGAVFGNPADLSLVRFQGDQTLPVDQRRNYKNVFDALRRIVKEEGFFSLWKGSAPTIAKAMSLCGGQLTSFEEIKQRVGEYRGKNDLLTRIISSSCSGVICACLSLPFDNLKVKLQKQKALPDGTLPYTGIFDCLRKSVVREGATGLWIGLPTYIVRIAPHSIISLLVMDYLHTYFGKGREKK